MVAGIRHARVYRSFLRDSLNAKTKRLSAYGLFELGKYKFNLANGLLLGFAFAALSNTITVWLQWNEFSLAPSLLQIIIQTMIFAAGIFLSSLAEDILTRAYLFCPLATTIE